jgi:glycopeptide antibiotics resistance protein
LIGNYSFVVYGVLLIFFIIFTFFLVPETKNKTIEEITAHFEKRSNQVNDSKTNLNQSTMTL